MKQFFTVSALIATAALISCQKQQTEAEKNAEVERQVQERLAAEHQAEQQQQLSQREADLQAREKALAEKENTPAATQAMTEQSETEPVTARPGVPVAARPIAGYSMFYSKLEPAGEWLETADYGYVWQPHEAERSRSWRPYTNGRWVYTDAGWTWISEEPFGWATYHYGRWTRLRGIGWVWVPGNEWAPAWVSWRKSNDYVGWAPLPPEARFDQRTGIHNWADNYYDIGPDQYAFVPSRDFGAQRVESTILPPERNLAIVTETTNVTNITYNNTTIVNEGPNYEELRAQSREPVQRFRLQRNANINIAAEMPRSVVQGETVIVAAPVIGAATTERPRKIKENVAQVSVDLGWGGIADQEGARKAREKMKSEAAPPSNAPPKKFVKAMSTSSATAETGSTKSSSSIPPSPAISATPAPTATATGTPESAIKSRRASPSEQSPPSAAASTPVPTAKPLATASQRRGRLLIPNPTPTPRATPIRSASASPTPARTVAASVTPAPSVAPNPTAVGVEQQGAATGKFKSQEQDAHHRKVVPMGEAAAPVAAGSPPPTVVPSQTEAARGKFKPQTQKSNPRETKPISSASPSPTATPTSNAASSTAPGGKPTKQEKKEQKREEKRELKRGNQPGAAASPSATP